MSFIATMDNRRASLFYYPCCDLRILAKKLASRLATQRNSLRKFNLRPLATTCRSVWPRLWDVIWYCYSKFKRRLCEGSVWLIKYFAIVNTFTFNVHWFQAPSHFPWESGFEAAFSVGKRYDTLAHNAPFKTPPPCSFIPVANQRTFLDTKKASGIRVPFNTKCFRIFRGRCNVN